MWNLVGTLYSNPAQTVIAEASSWKRAIYWQYHFLTRSLCGRQPAVGIFHGYLCRGRAYAKGLYATIST